MAISADREGVDRAEAEVSPAEFTRSLPEGQSAGPGAPETVEPTQGRGYAQGPGGPAMKGMATDAPAEGRRASGRWQSIPDVRGLLATVSRYGVQQLGRLGRGKGE